MYLLRTNTRRSSHRAGPWVGMCPDCCPDLPLRHGLLLCASPVGRFLLAAVCVAAGLLMVGLPGGSGQFSEPEWVERRAMTVRDQIEARGVRSKRVLDAIRAVPPGAVCP